MKASMPKRFLTLRDKNGSHRRSKSADPNHRARPLSSDAFFSIFKTESAKHAAKEDDGKGREAAKIEDITKRLAEQNIHHVTKEHIRYALASPFAAGDAEKAIDLLRIQQQSFSGIITPYNPNVHMVGAENRSAVTCYLDSLLFAMFAKLDAFECMLKNDLPEESQRKLAALIRLWVNMLRSGKLIYTDMTHHLQDALADAGWKDARLLEQQDTSEAFAFITETLQLPLLTLQVDLFHQGKGDADDHKVVYERLLNLAVPPDPTGKGVKLEDCLEDYFNAKVDVLRDSVEEKRGSDAFKTLGQASTIRVVTDQDDAAQAEDSHTGAAAMRRRWTVQSSGSPPPPLAVTELRPEPRHRSTSIIQRVVLDDDGKASTDLDLATFTQLAKRASSTVVKAVTIPAWQFFKLIPWHSASENEPQNDLEVARQLSQRPVVGICLKRYMMTESGQFQRHNTFIDIPDSMRLPQFMMVDDKRVEEVQTLNAEYKLVLQSVVCHRGDSLHSGHYVSFARVAPKLLTDNRRHDFDPPPDYEEAQWVKFDDLQVDSRVSYVDDIKQSLRDEMPYLLFYQVVPTVDLTTTASTEGSVAGPDQPPSYTDSTTGVNAAGIDATASEYTTANISRSTSGYFDAGSLTNTTALTTLSSGGPSIRLSSDLDRPSRLSFEDEPQQQPPPSSLSGAGAGGSARQYLASSTADTSRRGSLAFTDPSPAITPEAGPSPLLSQQQLQLQQSEDAATSTAQRLSRAAARTLAKVGTGGSGGTRSRPASQTGEGRISSAVMTKLGLVRSSREPLKEAEAASSGLGISEGVGSGGDPAVVVVVEETTGDDGGAARDGPEREKGKEKEHQHQHQHHGSQSHHLHRKEWSRGRKSGTSSDKEKDKEKEREKDKVSGHDRLRSKVELPERECVVM